MPDDLTTLQAHLAQWGREVMGGLPVMYASAWSRIMGWSVFDGGGDHQLSVAAQDVETAMCAMAKANRQGDAYRALLRYHYTNQAESVTDRALNRGIARRTYYRSLQRAQRALLPIWLDHLAQKRQI